MPTYSQPSHLKPPNERVVTDRSFLSVCPPRMRELFEYWDARRGRREMPRRADIDPLDFPKQLPRIWLVDVEGEDGNGVGHLRYRVVGTKEVELRGRDPTGLEVRVAYFGPSLEDVVGCYEIARRQRTFVYDPRSFNTQDGRIVDDEALFLPLSEDGTTVTQILAYVERRLKDGR